MIEKYLLIVEGEKTEKNIFEALFNQFGFNTIRIDNKLSKISDLEIKESLLQKDNKNIILIEGPANRIHDILINISPNPEDDINNIDVEALFGYKANEFRGIFWIYDVDHNIDEDIKIMFSKFNDENENGLLLLSSPCIEVLGDYKEDRILETEHLKSYKKELNDYYNKNKYSNVEDFIIKNIKELLLKYLKKNYEDFKDSNVMNHPEEVLELIKNNIRINNKEYHYVKYRYFSTVVYVAVAYIAGLTKKIDNYDEIYNYLKENRKK